MTLFGAGAVKQANEVNLIVNLELWSKDKKFERLGSTEEIVNILDVGIPKITIPVKTGRNLAIIIEVAAMNFRAKRWAIMPLRLSKEIWKALIKENTQKGE